MRPSWDDYFITMTDLVASRSTCSRKHVGAIVVKNHRLLATGYNGSLPSLPHCDDAGHDYEDSHCVRTVHAEVNSVADAARRGVSVEGATLYCNTMPCWNCFKTIVSAGIVEVVYRDEYRADKKDKVVETAAMIPGFVMRRLASEPAKEADVETKAVSKRAAKVRHTGKRAEKVGAAEVAKALGAEIETYPQLPLQRKKRK